MENVQQVQATRDNTILDTITVKVRHPVFTLLKATILLAIGLSFIIIDTQYVVSAVFLLLAVAAIGMGIWQCLKRINMDRIFSAVLILSISIIVASALLIFSENIIPFLNIILAVLSLVIAFLRISIVIHLISVKGPKIVRNIISAVVCIALAVVLFIFDFETGTFIIVTVIGIYLILYSITFFGDFFAAVTRSDLNREKVSRRSHFALPNFLTALQSTQIVLNYDRLLKKDPTLTKQTVIKSDSADRDVNFDILIHVSQILAKRMGHVDIAIGDTVYTYGCYDPAYNKLGGMISRGTFCILPKEPYLKNCLEQQRKYVIDYGCHMSDQQMTAIRNKIDEIFTHTSKSDIKYDPSEDKEGNDGVNTVAKLGGELYYVDDGPFKTYFAISSNCVQLADTIIGEAGFDTLSGNSLRTPGAYYRMMENMFKRKGTRVVKKTVYLQNEPGEKERLAKAAKEKAEQKKAEKKNK